MVLPIVLPPILPMNITAILRLIPYPFAVDFTKQLNVVLIKNC